VAHLTVERAGTTITREVFPELVGTDGIRSIGIGPRFNTNLQIDKVTPGSPADQAGLQPGDRFLALNGKPLETRGELSEYFQKNSQQIATLTYKRGDTVLSARLQPRLEKINGQEVYLIGIAWRFETVLIKKTPLEQFSDAYSQMYQIITSLFNRRSDIGVRHMSGIVGIVDNLQQAASAGVASTLAFLVLINISLATLNLLPIPVLDGGHILFATLAKIRGRPVNPILMQNAVAACFVMLIGLIVYVSYHDIRRAVENHMDSAPPPAKSAPAKP
jgi:regulator of sigma E protease